MARPVYCSYSIFKSGFFFHSICPSANPVSLHAAIARWGSCGSVFTIFCKEKESFYHKPAEASSCLIQLYDICFCLLTRKRHFCFDITRKDITTAQLCSLWCGIRIMAASAGTVYKGKLFHDNQHFSCANSLHTVKISHM